MTPLEKLFNLIKKPWFIGLYVVLIVCSYFFVDKPVAIYFHELNLRTNLQALNVFTALGQVKFYFVLFVLAGLFFRYGIKKSVYEYRAWYLFACVLAANLVGLFLKVTLGRARPDLFFDSQLYGLYWFKFSSMYWSLPSGHALSVTAIAAGLGTLFPRYFYALLVVAILVFLSRVVLCHHYLSDVMAGAYLGLFVVGLLPKNSSTT